MKSVPALQIKEVTKAFGSTPLFHNVSLAVAKDEIVCLLGRSGSGKSTLLKIVAGLLAPDHGQVFIDGIEVTHLRPQYRDLGLIFQETNALFPHLTVRQNILFAIDYGKREARRQNKDVAVAELLEWLQLEQFENRSIDSLSGGQRQRVAIARTLIFSPKVMLFDEPLNSLDNVLRRELLNLLSSLHRQLGGGYLYVTHDDREAAFLSTHVAVLDQGYLMQFGPTEAVFSAPATPGVADLLTDWSVMRLNGGSADWAGPELARLGPLAEELLAASRVKLGYRMSQARVHLKDSPKPKKAKSQEGLAAIGRIERCWPWEGRWRIRLGANSSTLEAEVSGPIPVGTEAVVELPRSACILWVDGKRPSYGETSDA